MLAAAELLRQARARGATVHTGCEVLGLRKGPDGAVTGATTSAGDFSARYTINTAGTWGGEVAAMAGVAVPVLPRKGFILVTEPLPPAVVRHKVYSADYVANVASGADGLETSVVVEGTRAGTVLVGASRERVGFDRRVSVPVLQRLAAQVIGLFPFLADVTLLRSYLGFRPYCPDHLPVTLLARPGMGLCQGRVCGYATAGLVARECGRAVAAQDLLGTAARPIAQPVTLGSIAAGTEQDFPEPDDLPEDR